MMSPRHHVAATGGCPSSHRIPATQPFPNTGTLIDNTNLPLAVLSAQIRKCRERAYSYIVRTVKLDRATSSFQQHGSAPKIQGDVLTWMHSRCGSSICCGSLPRSRGSRNNAVLCQDWR